MIEKFNFTPIRVQTIIDIWLEKMNLNELAQHIFSFSGNQKLVSKNKTIFIDVGNFNDIGIEL